MPSSKPISAPVSFSPDEYQRAAIEHVHGSMLVIAGAGTGKTTVLTRRIARLVREGHARADEILALTYTENAALEMRERVRKELGADVSVQAMTFHAYCFRLLDSCGKKFSNLDDKDLWIFLRKRIRELGLKYFIRAANVSKFLDDLLDFMRRCQDELVGPDGYAAYVEKVKKHELALPRVAKSKDELTDEELLGRCREIAHVYITVERLLAQQNLGTFGHMITRAYDLLRDDPELARRERTRARFILVDEFQDANFAQIKILERLSGEDKNIFAVGDPDQAIYRFRGASSAAFALFQSHFPGAKLVSLAKNQRSLAPILRCAHSLIDHNPPVLSTRTNGSLERQRRPLVSAREEAGVRSPSAPVQAVLWRDCELEAIDVVATIRKKQRELRCSWDRFAIIYRNHLHRDEVVGELSRYGIPYSIEGMDVLDTSEVRDLLACLGSVVSISDSASLFRVVALPQFGIKPEDLRAAIKAAGRDVSLAQILEKVAGGAEVLARLNGLREELQHSQCKAHAVLKKIMRYFELPETPAIRAVLEFVEVWERKPITDSGSIGELMEYLEYFREARGAIPLTTEPANAVRLMTAHAVKGLEFDQVFIIRAQSPSFPLPYREPLFEFPRELRDEMSTVEDEGKKLNDQEERRLFYVAMTRARDTLTIYGKQGKGKDSSPPGFVRELVADRDIASSFVRRNARPMQVDLFAAEARELPQTNLAAWLAMSPIMRMTSSLSATAIELYKTCPLQFKLEREWRIPGETPAAMQYGASIHRALRTFGDAVRFGREFTEEELLAYFRADLREAKIEDPYQHELYEKQGLQQLHDFVESWRRAPGCEILETEKEFKLRIGEATIAGRIDRMDQASDARVVIIDYKTGKPRSQEDADESLQLSLYAIAARECWGKNPDRLVFYNLETNAAVCSTRSELQLQEAKTEVEEVAQKIASGQFDPTPGFHCGFCAYRRLCPATEKQLFPATGKKKTAQSKIQ